MGVSGYPTLMYFHTDNMVYEHEGGRTFEALEKFVLSEEYLEKDGVAIP